MKGGANAMDGWNLKLYHQARSLFIIFLMTDKQAALSCDNIQFLENILKIELN